MIQEIPRPEFKLKACNPVACEAMCCHDGVYLSPLEEAFLVELVHSIPTLAAVLPTPFIIDGYWQGALHGRKTATKPHDYRNPEFPSHFPRTRCVFADDQGLCELEKHARDRNLHPWSFKPATCWLFPLDLQDGQACPPPTDPTLDPYRTDDYPGFVTCLPCGKHDPEGAPWAETLAAEVAYLDALAQVPVLGTPGHTVSELLFEKGTRP